MTTMGTASSARVLLVDDHEDSREVTALLLEAAGHQVEQTCSAEEALEQMEASPPDLLVTDLTLVGMSGEELALRMRDIGALAHVPVVAVTGHRIAGREHPFAAVILKPIDRDRFLAAVGAALGR
jgi:two-component system, cell cycle response regulator DivK